MLVEFIHSSHILYLKYFACNCAASSQHSRYAVAGESLYWNFFPHVNAKKWGRVPVWGVATVAASRAPAVPEGKRVYGYFPCSSYLVATPIKATVGGFQDGVEHRAQLPAVYNAYHYLDTDPWYSPHVEKVCMYPVYLQREDIDACVRPAHYDESSECANVSTNEVACYSIERALMGCCGFRYGIRVRLPNSVLELP